MKQKIKLTIPEGDGLWPNQYQGKTVEVDIANVSFPDGTYWSCQGDGFAASVELSGPEQAAPPVFSEPHPTIERLFGERVSSIHVDFFEKKERKP